VSFPDGGVTQRFRDFVTVLQDDVNLRYGAGCKETTANLGCAVGGIAAEGSPAASEDAEDSGSKAINYGAEPLWYRLGLAPGVPLTDPVLVENPNLHRVYANDLAGEDPKTPVFTAPPGWAVRFRVVEPGGHPRGHVFSVAGHAWPRQPYYADSDRINVRDAADATTQNVDAGKDGQIAGASLLPWWTGSQEGVAASSHFDVVIPRAGGPANTTGDYLFRDSTGFGNYQGLWGLLRVK
jgi:hypothetical protein